MLHVLVRLLLAGFSSVLTDPVALLYCMNGVWVCVCVGGCVTVCVCVCVSQCVRACVRACVYAILAIQELFLFLSTGQA